MDRKLNILLVEDHEDSAYATSRLLEAHGHQVRRANSVQSALAASAEQPFDLLISDLGLPDADGKELMRQLRDRMKGIALTGQAMEDEIGRAREAGFAEHLTKPVDFDRLREAIARVAGSN